jgi:hypothetical protein
MHTESLETGVRELCRATSCGHVDLLIQVVAVAWLVALVCLAVAAFTHVREARSEVASERRRTRDEAKALSTFRRRVSRIDAAEPRPRQAMVQTAPGLAQRGKPPDDGLRRVRDAYRETVMAVPHFEEDYGESLPTHLSAEFGEDVAAAVVDGDRFTPQLKGALVGAADDGQSRREDLLVALERESEALAEADDVLGGIDADRESAVARPLYHRSFEDLYDAWHRLADVERRLESFLGDRQAAVRDDRTVAPANHDREAFHAYLYGPLDVDYPVLAAGADLAARIRETRAEVLAAITRRV